MSENREIKDIDIVINVLKKHRDDLGTFHEERGGLTFALGALNALRGWAVRREEARRTIQALRCGEDHLQV